MAATLCCPKSIKACAMRLTRMNECGVVLDPLTPNARIQFSSFISASLSPDVEGGTDITTKNACGDICLRDKDCDRLKGFDVTITLCGVPLAVIEMLAKATLLDDGMGNFLGAVLRESKSQPCTDPVMLEMWSKNADLAACTVDGSSENLYVQWVLPRADNWEISGGLEFQDSDLQLELTGYAENNPLWFPSFPDATFPSWDPGGGDPTGTPTGTPPPVLPPGVTADSWSLTDQAAIQAGGPLAWKCVDALPTPVDDCGYVPVA